MDKKLLVISPLAKTIEVNSQYRHYKGNYYRVLALAHHSETLEELVVYQALDKQKAIWVRPLQLFLEEVSIEGSNQPRFQLIK